MEDSIESLEEVLTMTSTDSNKVLESPSPKPMAFTIDFDMGKSVDTQRHKSLVEKYQRRHRRGQSLSKIEDVPTVQTQPPAGQQKKPQSANLPRKSNFQSTPSSTERSPEEKCDKTKNVRTVNYKLRDGLSLPLKNSNTDKMTQSCTLPCIESPDIEIEDVDVSTPELEALRLPSPVNMTTPRTPRGKESQQLCVTPNNDRLVFEEYQWLSGPDYDFDKSDAVSDAGTYTLDADAYSEEQKARMSIDREFHLEAVSNLRKAHDYVQSLVGNNYKRGHRHEGGAEGEEDDELSVGGCYLQNRLSPIVSPTQNFSINSELLGANAANNEIEYTKSFNKIMFPSPKAKTGIGSADNLIDHGCVISVTSSGAFRSKGDKGNVRKLSLTKSEIHVETYTDNKHISTEIQRPARHLSANLVLVSETLPISIMHEGGYHNGVEDMTHHKVLNLPPAIGGIGGKMSPTKIPSPIHSARPRSRTSSNSLNIDLSDSSMETESYLRPTEKLLNTLQQRLSLDSDGDSDVLPAAEGGKYLNNDARSLLKKPTHLRHNSLDEKNLKISNKLEHFANKKFIDQTNVLNQFGSQAHPKMVHKIQNSPNNSPIRRSSSFSTQKNQINCGNNSIPASAKCLNIQQQKESNIRHSPGFTRNGSIQRSASTAAIRASYGRVGEGSHKIDRSQYGDTESSSEEDLLTNNMKQRKDITATRYNRAFSLRRARLDGEQAQVAATPPSPKCPNTPEMRRKFQPNERAISVDRKPQPKTPDVHSRYLQNLTKQRGGSTPPTGTTTTNTTGSGGKSHNQNQNQTHIEVAVMKSSPKIGNTATKPAPKAQVFSRTDTGRFSMRSGGGGGGGGGGGKPPMTNSQKTIRREGLNLGHKKPSGPRSNSSLTSKEVDFQNWKRRKSYDPMKAAAEGKRRAEAAKKQNVNPMTQSYHEANQQDCDSSPSHSSSVHRSQSFHGTAALEQYISSEDEEEDLTLSADDIDNDNDNEEGFSPPTPSPCEMSPSRTNRTNLRYAWKEQLH